MHWHITLVGRLRIHAVFAECRAGKPVALPTRNTGADRVRGRDAMCYLWLPTRAKRDLQERHWREAMPTYTWDHIHLRSPDPEATAQWFERILGAEIIRSMQQGKSRIDLKLGGANIFIAPVAAGDGVNPAPTTPYQGLDHFGLTVSGIDAIAAELKGKGVEFTTEPTTVRPGVRVCFIRGPQGISIELLERWAV